MRTFLHYVCVPLCFVFSSEDHRKEDVRHLLNEFLRLKRFNALFRSWHINKKDMLNFFDVLSCHRRTDN